MDGTRRADIKRGLRVSIVLKKDQQTGKLTEGIVRDILTNSPAHPHGIKVRLESGEIGRVKDTCLNSFAALNLPHVSQRQRRIARGDRTSDFLLYCTCFAVLIFCRGRDKIGRN